LLNNKRTTHMGWKIQRPAFQKSIQEVMNCSCP
jgi:hypothetical protein